uniref:Uncharacterized protein n=1 Tax=Romanomermis culicivorax TaxID=13658 RepID=A0A915J371_ROMCU
MNQCNAERNIPIYLVVGGAFGILRTFIAAVNKYRFRRMSIPETYRSDPLYLTDAVLSLFLVIWFFIEGTTSGRETEEYNSPLISGLSPEFTESKL